MSVRAALGISDFCLILCTPRGNPLLSSKGGGTFLFRTGLGFLFLGFRFLGLGLGFLCFRFLVGLGFLLSICIRKEYNIGSF